MIENPRDQETRVVVVTGQVRRRWLAKRRTRTETKARTAKAQPATAVQEVVGMGERIGWDGVGGDGMSRGREKE